MKIIIFGISLLIFLVSLYHYIKKLRTDMELLFYFLWVMLFSFLSISSDYSGILPDIIINSASLMFYVILTLLPPILYHIVFRLIEKESSFDRRNYYLPVTLFIINAFCIVYFGIEKDAENFTYEVVENVMTYVNYVIILFVFPIATVYYSYLAFKKLKPIKFNHVVKPESTQDFLLIFVLLYDLYIIVWVFQNYILPVSILKSGLKGYYVIYFVFSYWILYKAHKTNNVFKNNNTSFQFDLEELNSKLESVILIDKVFLDPNLTVKKLAKEIDSNEKYMSYLINKIYNKNFSNFINEHRIDFAKKILMDKEYKQYTIEAIGGLSGFNSKSGFNTLFKKYTGVTPSQFKKEKAL